MKGRRTHAPFPPPSLPILVFLFSFESLFSFVFCCFGMNDCRGYQWKLLTHFSPLFLDFPSIRMDHFLPPPPFPFPFASLQGITSGGYADRYTRAHPPALLDFSIYLHLSICLVTLSYTQLRHINTFFLSSIRRIIA